MGRWIRIAAAVAVVHAAAATAAITDVTFHGSGVVTYSLSNPPYLIGPAVGTPVTVAGNVHLGSVGGDPAYGYAAAPRDGFTGRYDISSDMLFDRYSAFHWSVSPGDSGDSTEIPNAASGGTLDFVHGRLTAASLFYVSDPDSHSIDTTIWGFDNGNYMPAYWGGTWKLVVASGTPEPASWALMIAGFGLTGGALRRRQLVA